MNKRILFLFLALLLAYGSPSFAGTIQLPQTGQTTATHQGPRFHVPELDRMEKIDSHPGQGTRIFIEIPSHISTGKESNGREEKNPAR